MMEDTTLHAFSDELVKIALFQGARHDGLVNTMREGWHGSLDPNSPDRATWFGKGRQIKPGMGRWARMGEEMASLGGATKALPIGGKTMMALGTGLMAREALRPIDSSGQNRSRAERLTGLAGNTVGGLVGSAVGNRMHPGLLGSLVGGAIGGIGAEKVMTAPFAMARHTAQPPQNQYAPHEGVQA